MDNRHYLQGPSLRLSALLLGITLSMWLGALVAFADSATPSDAQKKLRVESMYAEYRQEFLQVEDIDPESAIRLLAKPDVVFVDVRQQKEQAVSMIPGALTDDEFIGRLEDYRKHRIIVYCTISYRSGKLAAKLTQKGFRIVNLQGGLLGWVHAGGPLEKNGQAVSQLHVYGRKWNLAPAGIKTVF